MKTSCVFPHSRCHLVTTIVIAILLAGALARAATLTVTNTSDSGAGSLRDVIAAAISGDTIDFDPALTFAAPATITLTSGQIATSKDLVIVGPGADKLTISGNSASRVLAFSSATQSVTLSGLTFANATNTGGFGGAVISFANIAIRHCSFIGNSASAGGAVYVQSANASVISCLFNGNTATTQGGAFSFQATAGTHTLDMVNCTISGNAVTGAGFANLQIGAFATGISQVFVRCCTFADNTTTNSVLGESIVCGSDGPASASFVTMFGNIFKRVSSVTLAIHSQNGGPPGTYVSEGSNVASDNGGAFLAGAGDIINTDPLLAPLASNGGPTQTRALLPGSPAMSIIVPGSRPLDVFDVDGDSDTAERLPVDQRGITYARVSGGLMDAGAFQTQRPAPVASPLLGDAITGALAPDAGGVSDGTQFDALQRGAYFAENGTIVFSGTLQVGIGGVTVSPNNFQACWKHDGTRLRRIARTGESAPETGVSPAVFNILPIIPGVSDRGQVTLFCSLLQSSGSTPPTTADNDIGLWSELGGTGFQVLIRKDDDIPGLPGIKLDRFWTGCFATATTGPGTGEAVFAMTMKGASTDTALLRCSVLGTNTTGVSVVAREGAAAPGTGEVFGVLNGDYTGAVRMDATGNIVFGTLLAPSGRAAIWHQPVTGGAPVKVSVAGEIASGTSGATFAQLDVPAMGSGGTFAIRGVLNADGDNATNDKNDGIWRGTAASLAPILRRGDDNVSRPGLFSGPILTANPNIKAGNIYNGWLTNANHGAWLGWVDLGGDGISPFPYDGNFTASTDTFGIYSDTSGTMTLLIASGDDAPGIAGAKLFFIDHPVCGGAEQVAFIATVTGGGVTAGTNDKGVWRTASNGGAPQLVLRAGDTMTVNVNGTPTIKTLADVDIPGSGYADHIWETPVMDATGRLLIFVTFTDNSTTQVIVP